MMPKRIKFSEISLLKKGDVMPEIVNVIPLSAIKDVGTPEMLNAFKMAETGKWFGVLECEDVSFTFRHGVCQSFVKKIPLPGCNFKMNIINDNVDFRKETK